MSGETSIDRINPRRVQTVGLKRLVMTCLGLVLGSSWVQPLLAQEITVGAASTRLVDNVFRLDADLEYELPQSILDALDNGVVLTMVLDIEVYRPRDYLWDDELASLEQRYQVQYHALTEQYLLRNLNSGSQDVYPTLDAALFFMGRVRELPVIDVQLLEASTDYRVRIRSRLDFGSLPVPLQLRAYVSRDWWLRADWFSWQLQR